MCEPPTHAAVAQLWGSDAEFDTASRTVIGLAHRSRRIPLWDMGRLRIMRCHCVRVVSRRIGSVLGTRGERVEGRRLAAGYRKYRMWYWNGFVFAFSSFRMKMDGDWGKSSVREFYSYRRRSKCQNETNGVRVRYGHFTDCIRALCAM